MEWASCRLTREETGAPSEVWRSIMRDLTTDCQAEWDRFRNHALEKNSIFDCPSVGDTSAHSDQDAGQAVISWTQHNRQLHKFIATYSRVWHSDKLIASVDASFYWIITKHRDLTATTCFVVCFNGKSCEQKNFNKMQIWENPPRTPQWHCQADIWGSAKMFDFRRATVFLFGTPLLKAQSD